MSILTAEGDGLVGSLHCRISVTITLANRGMGDGPVDPDASKLAQFVANAKTKAAVKDLTEAFAEML